MSSAHISSIDSTSAQLGIDEFAAQVGMSARSIRAYQARGLLPPPRRVGKRVFYVRDHRKRIETIQRLQRQGFNLVAISALLGDDARRRSGEAMIDFLARLDLDDPLISSVFAEHGVLGRARAGNVVPLRPRLLRAALAMQDVGVSPRMALRLAAEMLEHLQVTADALAAEVGPRILAWVEGAGERPASGPVATDLDTQLLGAATAAVLNEAFRVVIEASCARRLMTLLDERDGDCDDGDCLAVDVG